MRHRRQADVDLPSARPELLLGDRPLHNEPDRAPIVAVAVLRQPPQRGCSRLGRIAFHPGPRHAANRCLANFDRAVRCDDRLAGTFSRQRRMHHSAEISRAHHRRTAASIGVPGDRSLVSLSGVASPALSAGDRGVVGRRPAPTPPYQFCRQSLVRAAAGPGTPRSGPPRRSGCDNRACIMAFDPTVCAPGGSRCPRGAWLIVNRRWPAGAVPAAPRRIGNRARAAQPAAAGEPIGHAAQHGQASMQN